MDRTERPEDVARVVLPYPRLQYGNVETILYRLTEDVNSLRSELEKVVAVNAKTAQMLEKTNYVVGTALSIDMNDPKQDAVKFAIYWDKIAKSQDRMEKALWTVVGLVSTTFVAFCYRLFVMHGIGS